MSDQIPVHVPRHFKRQLRFELPPLRAEAQRALPIILPVTLGGAAALAFAIRSLASGGQSWDDLAGIAVLLAAATAAEAFPVPIEGVAVGAMSLATIFLVAVAVIYGWPVATVVGFLTMTLVEVGRRRPASRVAFNCGVYVLAAAAAGAAAAAFDDGVLVGLVLAATVAANCFYLVNIALLAAVVSSTREIPLLLALRRYVFLTLVPFAIMASLTVILVVLWDRSPFVAVVLVGPLLATALYQRWIHRSLERLREFDRLKDEFIAVVSHELRTPLTSVYGAAITLGQHELDDDRRDALLRIVSTESERLARLLDDILWVSRLDSGPADVVIAPVEPVPLVSEIVEATRMRLPPELSVDLRHPGAVPPVAADADKLRQVLVNLVENAVKYSSKGHIEVVLQPHNGAMHFSVRDQGIGIPQDEQDRIFEKFHRLDPDMQRGVGGTGLGLYICQELVERMHGRIWVESEPGTGSTFTFELPVASSS
ncbi:MAG TPA: HAMP domain-containing sensor histidine kinase [Gaiellaceae bacterium]